MSDLTEALEQWGTSDHMTADQDRLISAAARRWAELEAEVANGARVIVETPCKMHDGEFCMPHCRRIILREGADQ